MVEHRPTSDSYHPYGNTCPLLKIAQQYQVPYELPLAIADLQQHGRPLSEYIIGVIKTISRSRLDNVERACKWVSRHTIDLRAGLAVL